MRLTLTILCCMALAACSIPSPRAAIDDARGYLARTFAGAPEAGGACGDPWLVGEEVGSVPGPGACGVENAVALSAVGGISLSQTATLSCGTARTVRQWIDDTAGPAFAERGGLSELQVAAHYVCRTRNHQPGARLSEHSFGRAIDFSAFRTATGEEITVSDGWRDAEDGPILRKLHEGACGPFGTVLGPGSDGFHENHFHFDTAQHRGGSYCR